MRADLHIHTTASDGRWSPERLLAELRAHSIELFAVTDHDTVDNVKSTESLVRGTGLAFLRGVEVTTKSNGTFFHILAYGFDANDASLLSLLRANRSQLDQANTESIRHLVAAGHPIDMQDYDSYEYDRERGGWRSLNFLIDRGICKDIADYFAHPDVEMPFTFCSFPHPAKAIAVIRRAGGVPVLAHPGATLQNGEITEEALQPLLEYGIGGVECYHRHNDEATTRLCLDWCARHDLIVTIGSDCHGGLVDRELGFPAVDTADLRLGELGDRIIC